jgi:hypothetical protein
MGQNNPPFNMLTIVSERKTCVGVGEMGPLGAVGEQSGDNVLAREHIPSLFTPRPFLVKMHGVMDVMVVKAIQAYEIKEVEH